MLPDSPKALRRRAALAPTRPSLYELALEGPVSRTLTSVNVLQEDKSVFDGLQGIWSHRKGRRVKQWEAFTFLLADAQANPQSEAFLDRRA